MYCVQINWWDMETILFSGIMTKYCATYTGKKSCLSYNSLENMKIDMKIVIDDE